MEICLFRTPRTTFMTLNANPISGKEFFGTVNYADSLLKHVTNFASCTNSRFWITVVERILWYYGERESRCDWRQLAIRVFTSEAVVGTGHRFTHGATMFRFHALEWEWCVAGVVVGCVACGVNLIVIKVVFTFS